MCLERVRSIEEKQQEMWNQLYQRGMINLERLRQGLAKPATYKSFISLKRAPRATCIGNIDPIAISVCANDGRERASRGTASLIQSAV